VDKEDGWEQGKDRKGEGGIGNEKGSTI